MPEAAAPATPALGISLNYAMSEGRSLVLQTHIASDQIGKPLDALLDELLRAVSRQAAKFEIEALKKNLEANERQLLQTTEDLNKHKAKVQAGWETRGRKGEYKETPQEESASRNLATTQKRLNDEIAKINELIAEREKKIAA